MKQRFIESETTELKQELSKAFTKEVVAFLNTNGGIIYIGVSDKGKIVGVNDVNTTMRNIRELIENQILPACSGLYEISSLSIYNKYVISVKVKKGDRLYYIKKEGRSSLGCFIRVGSCSVSMKDTEIESRFREQIKTERELLKDKPSLRKDLTFNTLKLYLSNNGIHINQETFLQNFNLILDDGRFNLLAELLADENFKSLMVCSFKGIDKTDYLKYEEFGNVSILKALEKSKVYCEALNETFVNVDEHPRIEVKKFNFKAFEEAWVNAIVHNDWLSGISPQVSFFKNRIEIISHGGLPDNLTEEDFFKGISRPVNPDLMHIFKSCNIVEHTGHGVPEVIRVYGKEAYSFHKSFIIVTLPLRCNPFTYDDNEDTEIEENKIVTYLKASFLKFVENNPNVTLKEISQYLSHHKIKID